MHNLIVEIQHASQRLDIAISGYLCPEMLPKDGPEPYHMHELSIKGIKNAIVEVRQSLDKISEMVEKAS